MIEQTDGRLSDEFFLTKPGLGRMFIKTKEKECIHE